MDEFLTQINSLVKTVDYVCNDVEQNKNFKLIPDLMDIMETVLPNVFLNNNESKFFNNEEILMVLDDIVNAFENNDTVLMTDVLKYGLNERLNRFIGK